MNAEDIGKMSVLSLAHVGDAVYELLVRTCLAEKGFSTVVGLHRETVALVKAPAQARAAAVLLPRLTEQGDAVYRRGRNSHGDSVPRGATKAEYHAATALEAVFGYLWLTGAHGRVHELFEAIMEVEDAT